MAKVVINPKAMLGGAKGLIKDMSIGAAVAVVEGGIEIVDKVHEAKGKRRKDNIELMKELEELKEKGIITQEEFEKKREKVVKKI